MSFRLFDVAAEIPIFGGQDPFLKQFLAHLPEKITSDAEHRMYDVFGRQFGTHTVASANFGGKIVHDTYVDMSYYQSKDSSWISTQVELLFHFDCYNLSSGGFGNRSSIEKHLDEEFRKHS